VSRRLTSFCLPSSVAKATRAAQMGQSSDEEYDVCAANASRAAERRKAAAAAAADGLCMLSSSSLHMGQLEQVDAVVVVVFVVLVSVDSPQL